MRSPSIAPAPAPDPRDEMSRRAFLRRVGVGAATALVVADGLLAYRAYDQGVLAEGTGPAFEAWRTWRDGDGPEALVGAAILAASAHNTQPWAFAVGADRIDLYADLSRSTGANDALDRELYVSLGCALENLLTAAPARGLVPTVELLPGEPDLVAGISLREGPRSDSARHRAIGERHSNRAPFEAEPLPPDLLAAMGEVVDATVAPARLVWLTEDAARRRYGDLLVESAEAHVADDEQSRASFAWWRSDWNLIQERKDGLTIDGVGLSPLVRTAGKLLPAPSRADADATFLERTRLQADSAAAFGVVVVDDPRDRTEQVVGGQLLERLHLWAAANGLGFQPMNQITEQIDRDHQQGRPSRFEQPLADLVGPGALVAFRVGRPTQDGAPSPRRPVAEVLR